MTSRYRAAVATAPRRIPALTGRGSVPTQFCALKTQGPTRNEYEIPLLNYGTQSFSTGSLSDIRLGPLRGPGVICGFALPWYARTDYKGPVFTVRDQVFQYRVPV